MTTITEQIKHRVTAIKTFDLPGSDLDSDAVVAIWEDIPTTPGLPDGSVRSFFPARHVNSLPHLIAGNNYWIITNVDCDLSEYFELVPVPFTPGQSIKPDLRAYPDAEDALYIQKLKDGK